MGRCGGVQALADLFALQRIHEEALFRNDDYISPEKSKAIARLIEDLCLEVCARAHLPPPPPPPPRRTPYISLALRPDTLEQKTQSWFVIRVDPGLSRFIRWDTEQ